MRIIEFTGTPEAGKTTQIHRVSDRLKDQGFSVQIVQESAEIMPKSFSKGSVEASRWMQLNATMKVLEATSSENDIILVDRGIIDAMFWQQIYYERGLLQEQEMSAFYMFVKSMKLIPDLTFYFYIEPELAIRRRGGEGRITTREFVEKYNSMSREFFSKRNGLKFLEVDGSCPMEEITKQVVENILKN